MSWSLASPDKPWFVYVLAEEGCREGPVKVGTANNVAYRISGLQGGNWRRLVLHATANCPRRSDALAVERALHARFAEQRFPGRDWLRVSPDEVISFLETHPLVTGGAYGQN